jgi:hypothetical protein
MKINFEQTLSYGITDNFCIDFLVLESAEIAKGDCRKIQKSFLFDRDRHRRLALNELDHVLVAVQDETDGAKQNCATF